MAARAGRNRRRLVAVLVAGLVPAILASGSAAAQQSSIDRVTVHEETRDRVVLTVEYTYDGGHGDPAFLSAVMATDGTVSPHYAYRPGRVERGRHRTRVTLGLSADAPDLVTSNQLRVRMYDRDGDAFLTRTLHFPKTWSRPGAALRPVLTLAEPALPEDGPPPPVAAPQRRILPGGTVEVRLPDGTVQRLSEGRIVVERPGGPDQILLFQNAQPPTPPAAPPDPIKGAWLTAVSDRLLDIMRLLVGGHEPSIENYLAQEGPDWSPYQRIDARTRAIDWLVRP
jgi:hypothetical protein